MLARVERRRQSAGPTASSSTEVFLPEPAISALQSHPCFQEAVQAAIEGLIKTYGGNRRLNRVLNDRGRVVGSLIALYLHFAPALEGKGAGLTVGRFQAFCWDMKVCSPGRARALLRLMQFEGYLAPAPRVSDRRLRRLVPTEHLIELHRQKWKHLFEVMALITPAGRKALEVHGRPEFMAAFLRHLGASYLAGFRPLHFASELAHLSESNGGLLVISSLFLSAADAPTPGGTTVPVSISALSVRFGIARAHARQLLADAAEAGLVRRTDRIGTVIVLPRLNHAVSNFFAALFALFANCAEAAADEIGSLPWSVMPTSVAEVFNSGSEEQWIPLTAPVSCQ